MESPKEPFFAKWQHVIAMGALFVAISGGAIAVYFQFFARDEARLDTDLLAEVVIVDLRPNEAGNFELSYKNEMVRNVSTVSLLVTNTGKTNLKPLNAGDLGDLTNARITISLEDGMRILEATAQWTGEDASSKLERLESPEKHVATFVVLLMNIDAQVAIDLIVAGLDVAEAIDVKVMGEGLKGEFLRSMSEDSAAVRYYRPWLVSMASAYVLLSYIVFWLRRPRELTGGSTK